MKKIDTAGAVSNEFQDGDPATGEAATICSSDWLNIVQQELCNVITGAGLTIDQSHMFQDDLSGTENNTSQLLEAIQLLIGGIAPASGPFTVPNGSGSLPLNIGVTLNPALGHSARIPISVYRTYTISSVVTELAAAGNLMCRYKPIAGTWVIDFEPFGDDVGLEFGMSGNNIALTLINSYAGTSAYTGSLTWGTGIYT